MLLIKFMDLAVLGQSTNAQPRLLWPMDVQELWWPWLACSLHGGGGMPALRGKQRRTSSSPP
eukprot:3201639-Lingulodinium_polyedra.AAC.1